MSVEALAPIVGPALDLVRQIVTWIDEGLSPEEIQKRLADPTGVGRDMIDRIAERRAIGERLLGRDPR
jgi:hypothetical protein